MRPRIPWPDPPPEKTWVDFLQRRAATLPDREIYHLLDDDFFDTGIVKGPSLTFAQLDRLSRAIAVALSEHVSAGDRVLLLFDTGLEFMPAFFGCLYAGVIPVPAYPPYRGLQVDPLATLRGISANCEPSAVITGGPIAETVRQLCQADPRLDAAHWFTTELIEPARADEWRRPNIDEHTIGLLQYTSGSTGSPQGVIVSHRNMLKNEYILQLAFDHMTHERPGVGVCWLPFHHDMGLIGSVLQSVFVDGPCYFMSPLQFIRKPVRWLQAITHLRPQTSGGPNFAYELCVRKVTDEQKAQLDLSALELAYVGAEAISADTIERFTRAFEPCGLDPTVLYPSYGLAEGTLIVTGGDWMEAPIIRSFVESEGRMQPVDDHRSGNNERVQRLVGCGHPWQGHEVVIVDPEQLTECDEAQIGEIWVSGPCVAQGYWNQAAETQQTFAARLADDAARGPFLRTGDLGFLNDDELYVSGRLKDVIIIRGRNYYPDDIEATIRDMHDAFRPGTTAVLGVKRNGEERLVVLQEIDRQGRRIDTKQLATDIRQHIAEEHQLQLFEIVFLRNGSLPKTTSGKIKRFACRQMYEAGQLPVWKGKSPA